MTLGHCALLGFAITCFWSIPIVGICLDKRISVRVRLLLIVSLLTTFLAITFGTYILGVLK